MRFDNVKNIYEGDCAITLIDISGFTAISELLAKKGKRGAEEITLLINGLFSIFIDIIHNYGGEIIHFSGDAISVILYKDNFNDYKIRAITIVNEITNYIKKNNHIVLKDGEFEISVHCGVSSGNIYRIFLKQEDKNPSFIYYGTPINNAARLLDIAKKNQIVIDNTIKSSYIKAINKNNYKILKKILRVSKKQTLYNTINTIELSQIDILRNSHRYICIVFINIKLKKQISKNSQFLKKYLDIVNTYNLYADKFDFYHTGIKSMIVAGAPKSLNQIEIRTLHFIDSIKQLCNKYDYTFKIGINSGYAFCGIIGNELRKEYTIMGDVVNTAARIMSYAKDNEILISHGFYSSVYQCAEFSFKNELLFKGKSKKTKIYCFNGNILARMDDYWHKHIFIGRNKQIKSIKQIIKNVLSGNNEGIYIQGNSGAGKTLFIKHILETIGNDFAILLIKCNEFNKNTPFFGIRELINMIIGKKMYKYDKQMSIILNITNNQKKSILKYIFNNDSKYSYTDNQIFTLCAEILNNFFQQFPLAIVIDDHQWLDEKSFEFINYYRKNKNRNKKLFIFAGNENKLTDIYTTIDLGNFNSKEIKELLNKKYNSSEITRHLSKLLISNTKGHPLMINEILYMLEKKRSIEKRNNNYIIHIDKIQSYITNNIESYINAMLETMKSDDKYLLSILAIFGDKITIKEYEQLTGRLLKNISSDLYEYLIFSNNYMWFKNEIIKKSIYSALSFSFKLDIHFLILYMIEKGKIKRNIEFKINHLIASEQYEKALPLCIKIAEKQKTLCQFKTALYYYDNALKCIEKVNTINNDLINLFQKDI